MIKAASLSATLIVALSAQVASAQTIDTRDGGNLASFGGGGRIFAQSFTAPTTNAVLTDFSFWFANTGWNYTAKLFAFNATTRTTVGPALFTSASRTVDNVSLDEENFAVGALELIGGGMYLAIIQSSGEGQSIGAVSGGAYTAGQYYQANVVDPTTAVFSTGFGPNYDLQFTANFESPVTATPEPASMTLMATGIAGVAGWARRRRKAASAA